MTYEAMESPCIFSDEGGLNEHGYRRVQWRDAEGVNRQTFLHRKAYEDFYGVEIEKGNHIHHVCGVRECVNPHHLQQVTPAEHNAIHRELKAVAA